MNATHLGFYNTATTRTHVRFGFSTHNAAGANVAPSSAIDAADIRIYKATDGAALSATQRSSAAGITVTSPFDSLTGFHTVDIDLTDNTDASFYATGSLYAVVLAPDDETIDSQVITGAVLAYFEIGVRKADVTQWLGTAVSTPTVAGVPNVNAKTWNDLTTVALPLVPTTAGRTLDVSAGGEAGVDWANVGTPTTTLNLSGTTTKNVTDIATTLAAAPTVAQIWDEAMSGHTTSGTFGDKLRASLTAMQIVVLDAGSDTTHLVFNTVDGAAASSTDDVYNGRVFIVTSGTLAKQACSITDYVGSTKTATISALTGSAAAAVTGVLL